MNPYRNTLWLTVGDFLAKAMSFLALVYLARILGVVEYGVLEFAITIVTYFVLLADGGLEVWSTREVARGTQINLLATRVIGLRILFASLAYGLLILSLPWWPEYDGLQPLLVILGLSFWIQAFNPKWFFLGKEKLRIVSIGLIITQFVFALLIFILVNSPEQLVWVAWIFLISELISLIFFGGIFIHQNKIVVIRINFRETLEIVKPAATIGFLQALGLISYNFDSLMLGFLVGAESVGYYRAAYKPITASLGAPLTYLGGLFPALSRAVTDSRDDFWDISQRMIRQSIIIALPIGVCGTLLAGSVIGLLYGDTYQPSIIVMQILSWSAVITIIRASLRHGIIAAGFQNRALWAAFIGVGINIGLNLLLIPNFGVIGASVTTLISDLLWLLIMVYDYSKIVKKVHWINYLYQPVLSVLAMGLFLYLFRNINWILIAFCGVALYLLILFTMGNEEVRIWFTTFRLRGFSR